MKILPNRQMEEMAMNRKWSVGFGRRLAIGLRAAALAAGLLPTAAFAQDYPTRPVTFVVGIGVGSSSDRPARAPADFLQPELGTQVSLVNPQGSGRASRWARFGKYGLS